MFLQLIKARNTTEAENLIVQMDITELGRVDDNKYTALHWAAQNGQEKVCELLLSKMNPQAINAADNDGCTALHQAAYKTNKEICELLIPKMTPQTLCCYMGKGRNL